MKAAGIVRRIDDLGRVVVPEEIQRDAVREEQAMEIAGREGEVILKKYSPIEELAECAAGFYKIDFNGDRMSRLCFGSGTDCGGKRVRNRKIILASPSTAGWRRRF